MYDFRLLVAIVAVADGAKFGTCGLQYTISDKAATDNWHIARARLVQDA